MADNIDITPGSGKTVATDEISIDGATAHVQRVKVVHGAAGSGVDASDAEPLPTRGPFATIDRTITRPADTTAYAANDVWADSTSAPTSGGFSLTGAARASGKSGIITDLVIVNSSTSALTGEIWIFDSSVTAVNDNAAFALSDSDALKLVAIVPFVTAAQPSNAVAHVQGLGIGFTCSGSADLRFLVKVIAAYTPASAETLTVRAKIVQVN